MNRKYMPLMVGGLVVVLIAAGLFFWMFSARGDFEAGLSGLNSANLQLQRLTGRSPFPADGNVQSMGKQMEIYQKYLNGLRTDMTAGQRAADPVTRDAFRRLLEETLRQLGADARAKEIILPPYFAFGFQRYAEGVLPTEEEMNRLVDQLYSVKALCEVFYKAGISEIISVDRTVFEKDAQAAPVEEEYGRRSSRVREDAVVAAPTGSLDADPLGLYTREHYVVTYKAPDAATWRILDRLADGAPFVVITQVEIVNAARPLGMAPAAKVEPPPPLPRAPLRRYGLASPRSGRTATRPRGRNFTA